MSGQYDESLMKDALGKIDRVSRVQLAFLPTPVSELKRLTAELGGPTLFMKHDNQTGLAMGGNKTRKLEFSMAEALAAKATHVITCGAQQSNHARQTAAACAKLGLKCHIVFENRRNVTPEKDHSYLSSGNVLLIDMLGATHEEFPAGSDMNALMQQAHKKIAKEGGTPFIVPGGASDATGGTAYANCALEILQQAKEMGIRIDHLVTASGSAGTHAGLATGLQIVKSDVKLWGIGTRAAQEAQETKVYNLALKIVEKLGISKDLISRDFITANCNFVGPGYGEFAANTMNALLTVCRAEGYFIEPAYTAKAMDGLITLIKGGHFKKGENVMFLHTGGEAAVFGYADEIRARL